MCAKKEVVRYMAKVEIIKADKELTNRNKKGLIEILRVGAYCRVSTDTEDQISSYKSQVAYYDDLIDNNPNWIKVDIYADEAITGTQVTKRTDFQRLINDCMNHEIDMVITKSISRFARNTLDTLKYVRMLKEKNVAVYFEDEKINTLTMDGELLLVVLSSVAQQEVENISANVKKGLKMKMSRGELIGFNGCLGYDYHAEDKSLTVNEEEAETVRYIFNRYIEGAGCFVIARELQNLGYKTAGGKTKWFDSSVRGIIKNEKYVGDIRAGKTFTVDPISKRRLKNLGEEDQFYIRDHHDPIISREVFEKAHEILSVRAESYKRYEEGKSNRNKFTRQYAFSCIMECGYCGARLTRRHWMGKNGYSKIIWQCVTYARKGHKSYPHCKGVAESLIEEAFVKSYQYLFETNSHLIDDFMLKLEQNLSKKNYKKEREELSKKLSDLSKKRNALIDMKLDSIIDDQAYESKYYDLTDKINLTTTKLESVEKSMSDDRDEKERLQGIRQVLVNNQTIESFDRKVFESIISKVIIGGFDSKGNACPYNVTFVLKSGLSDYPYMIGMKPQANETVSSNNHLPHKANPTCGNNCIAD